MNKVLLCIGLLLLLIGSGVIVQQKLHEPYYREDLFTETSPALVYRDEPVLKTIHLPRQKNVYVYIETYGSLPITFSVHTLTDYEHNRSHPLVNASTTTGSFSGSFFTSETTQYVFELYASYRTYEAYTEDVWPPSFWYTLGVFLVLIGSITMLLNFFYKKK